MMSAAVSAVLPYLSAAISPASPCMYVAMRAAVTESCPRANRASTMPVRVSPLPAVAIPGFPVLLKWMSPSGVHIAEQAPFNIMQMLYFCASSVAFAICSSRFFTPPARRANSPGCGVIMLFVGSNAKAPGCLEIMFRASASSTMGTLHWDINCSNACSLSLAVPNPGPTAIAV